MASNPSNRPNWQSLSQWVSPLLNRPSQPLDRQRRRLLLMGVGALIASVNSSCVQSTQSSEGTETATTRPVQHAYGETAVPLEPLRVAVLGIPTTEAVMALGVKPIAAPAIVLDNLTHLPAITHEVLDIGSPLQPNLDTIALAKPDLIVTSKATSDANSYQLLSQIAPTVAFDIDDLTEWKTVTKLCGEALGKDAEAKQLATEYEAKLGALKSTLDQDLSEIQVSVVIFYPTGLATLGNDSFPGTVLADAGLSRPPEQTAGSNLQISMELLETVDGDAIFLLEPEAQTELAADMRDAIETMKNNPLWVQLGAVQADKVYAVGSYWYGAGYLAANRVLDDLIKYLAD